MSGGQHQSREWITWAVVLAAVALAGLAVYAMPSPLPAIPTVEIRSELESKLSFNAPDFVAVSSELLLSNVEPCE